MDEAQTYLDQWEARWADTRIHGTTKRQVAAMFAEEKAALLPLPVEPFRYYQYGERMVHLDGCVEVEAAYYSAPPGWVGRRVQVHWDARQVRLLDPCTGQLPREHLRQARGRHRIKEEDRPQKTPLGTMQLLARADRAGSHIRRALPRHAPRAWRDGRAPHPESAVAGEEIRSRQRRRLRRHSGNGRLRIPFVRRYLERPATAIELAASRPLDPPAHALPRLHPGQNERE